MYTVRQLNNGNYAVQQGRETKGRATYLPSTETPDKGEAQYRAKVMEMEYKLERIREQMHELKGEDAKELAAVAYSIVNEYDAHPENTEPEFDPHGFLA